MLGTGLLDWTTGMTFDANLTSDFKVLNATSYVLPVLSPLYSVAVYISTFHFLFAQRRKRNLILGALNYLHKLL